MVGLSLDACLGRQEFVLSVVGDLLLVGVAVFGAVAAGGLASGAVAATAACWWLVAALGLAVAALGYLTTTDWARITARRTAARLSEEVTS